MSFTFIKHSVEFMGRGMFRVLFLSVAVGALISSCNRQSVSAPAKSESFSFSYQVTVPSLPPNAKEVEVIIPAPPSDDKQTISNFRVASNIADSAYVDEAYKNNILIFRANDSIPKNINITVSFNATRNEQAPIDSLEKQVSDYTYATGIPDSLKRYLLANRLVPMDGPIVAEADSVVTETMTPFEKAQALYDHLFETMKYDKTGTGWGHGDALYACDARRGNCTDIHSLFIGMARSQGIPARFRMGFPLPDRLSTEKTNIPGYHCWAEFYIPDAGWIPVDISEAIKHPEKKDYYFGRLDPNRIAFTLGRDIIAPTFSGNMAFNYLIYPQVFVDGERFEGAERQFTVSAS